jgi:Fe-S-cluster-containing hydrogenase component 2
MSKKREAVIAGFAGRHIQQVPFEESLCVGCNGCELVCALTHEGAVGPSLKRLFLERGEISLIHVVHTCRQCSDHPCYEACPKKDEAICIDAETGVAYIDSSNCIGCKLCIKACPFTPKRINFDASRKVAVKCDLCRGRENGPACIEYCQAQCLAIAE